MGCGCRSALDWKINIRTHIDVFLWTLIIVDLAVVGVVAYYRLIVSPILYEPILPHAITVTVLLSSVLGYFFLWQIMLGQNHSKALRRMNETDGLTGIHTRARFFMDAGGVDASRCTVMMIDVDRFKSINDTYGHPIGDEVLIRTVERLGAVCRSGDMLARYGGEEFIVCLPVTSEKTARRCAERLRLAVGAVDVSVGDFKIPVTVSIGSASGVAGDNIDTLIARADKALLLAKSGGRNRVVAAEDVIRIDPDDSIRPMRRTSRF